MRPKRQMEGYREAVANCGFHDLGFVSLPYTWGNRQEEGHNVKARLDRGLGTEDFLELYPDTTVYHVQTSESDHCCLIVECREQIEGRRMGGRPFRYENMWRRDASYEVLVTSVWDAGEVAANLSILRSRLGRVQGALQEWDRNVFGSVRKTIPIL